MRYLPANVCRRSWNRLSIPIVQQHSLNTLEYFSVKYFKMGLLTFEACEAVYKRIIDINGGQSKVNFNDKIGALSKNGDVGCALIQDRKDAGPTVAPGSRKGFKAIKGIYLIEL